MRYFLISMAVLLLIVFGIVIFSRSGNQPIPSGKSVALSNYVNNPNGDVSFTVDGPINAPEAHRSVRITVDPTNRKIEIFAGYDGATLVNQIYPNSTNSYSDFLAALNRANFTRQRVVASTNYQSICPLGNRSTYQVMNGSQTTMKTWSASCINGSFGGDASLTSTLFQAQIPDYNALTSNISVNAPPTLKLF